MADASANPWDIDWKAAAPATPTAEPWNVDWSAHPAAGPSLAHEAAAIGVTGPIKGAAALLSAPGAVGNWLARGSKAASDYIAEKTGLDKGPELAEPVLGTEGISKASDLLARGSKIASDYIAEKTGLDKGPDLAAPVIPTAGAHGPLPEAQTEVGKLGQSVTEFVPAALATGGGAAVPNLVRNAVLPGLGSEALGSRFEGTWLEPYARLLGAIGGGVTGAVGGKGAEMLANRGAARTAAGEIGGDVSPAAVAKVAKNVEADQLTPAGATARQAELGPEAMFMDMGRQLGGRAEAIAAQPGKGQNKVLDAVEGRTGTFGSGTAARVGNTLDQTMGPSQDVVALKKNMVGDIGDMMDGVLGPSPDIVATRNGINAAVDKHAKPLYENVMGAHPVVDVPASITSRPVVAQAMKDAEQLAKNHGENITGTKETQTILAGPGYHIAEDVTNPAKTSLRYWDYVKKALDSRVSGMMKTGGIQDLDSAGKADLGGLMDAKKALVSHLDNATDGAYAVARRAAATKFQVNDAIDLGRSALNTKLLPEELGEHIGGMSIPERAGVQLGMRREMQRIIDTAPDDAAAARKMLDTNQNRDKITQVFGKPAMDSIDRWVNVHDALDTGRSALNTKLLPEELAAKMQGMGSQEKTLLQAGMRREIDRIIDTARNDGAAARRILDTNQNREKIAQVFGTHAADAVDKRIAAETHFQETTNKVASNSRTAVRQQLMKDTEAPNQSGPPMANLTGFAVSAARRGQQYLGDLSLERTKEGIADLLTRRGNDIPRLADILSRHNAARTANAAAPIGQQTRNLASVLAAQTPGLFNGYLPGPRNNQTQ
jgi:hypothetical protein